MTKKMIILDEEYLTLLKEYVILAKTNKETQLTKEKVNDILQALDKAEKLPVTYYHVYDDDYDCGLYIEDDLRKFIKEQ